jgi:hypothetical protein
MGKLLKDILPESPGCSTERRLNKLSTLIVHSLTPDWT